MENQEKPERTEVPISVKELIIKKHKDGMSLRAIGSLVGRTYSTIQTVISNYNKTGSVKSKQRSGRPRVFTDHEENLIVRRVLKSNGYRNCRARKKLFISERNRKERLNFAKLRLNYDKSFWSKVIFSNESKFNIHHNDGPIKIYRQPNTAYKKQNLVGTVEHGGGGVLVWGCMSAAGLDILKNNLQESAVKLGLNGSYILQQDNDPKHSARLVQE
ncbi:hypothetical protein ILUMI_06595 [Ignelater luminosus]|uniref:Transposase n=1 Tax=Ignelater luminosus TaxID=2038154 RepID=A0A8K0DF67_IGNLU|nr:hypothetical protein ILUMI_06595 [Ignelater luminosus]